MFYKHWKKLALSLTGFFWASCGSDVTSPTGGDVNSSSSSSDDNLSSSSEVTPESSSSDYSQIVPLYGILIEESSSSVEQNKTACYEDGKGVKTNDEVSITKLICDDDVVCKETEVIKGFQGEPCSEGFGGVTVCPDYGIVVVSEKTYECNGIKFNEAEFRSRYDRKYTTKPESSSSVVESSSSEAQSSSSYNICLPEAFFCESRAEKYTESQAKSSATEQAKWDGARKVDEIISEQFKDKKSPQCLDDLRESLESGFVALYGVMACSTPSKFRCSDGTTYLTPEFLEQQEFDKEQAKKKPQYDEKYNEFYKEETEKLDREINDCLNSEQTEE